MYEKGQDSFQMFSLDGLHRSLVGDSPYWPVSGTYSALNWRDAAILKDVSSFFDCAYNRFGVVGNSGKDWGKAPSSDLGDPFPLENPFHASPKAGDVRIDPGWTGDGISNLLRERMDEIAKDGAGTPPSGARSCLGFEFLPPQLDFSRTGVLKSGDTFGAASRRCFVNSFLGYLASSDVFSAIERSETDDEFKNLVNSIEGRGVPVKKGSVRFPTEPVVVSRLYKRKSGDGDWQAIEAVPEEGHDSSSAKRILKEILGVQSFSELSLTADVDELFGPKATSEFVGTSLSAAAVDSCYEATRILCGSDTLYLGYHNNGTAGTKGPYDKNHYPDYPKDQDPKHVHWYFVSETCVDNFASDGVYDDEFLQSSASSRSVVITAYAVWQHDIDYYYQGTPDEEVRWDDWTKHQEMTCTCTSGEKGPFGSIWTYNYPGVITYSKELELGLKLMFSIGCCGQFMDSDGRFLDVKCKVLIPVIVSMYRECSSEESGGVDTLKLSDMMLIPLDLHPFESQRNRDAGTYQIWESDVTVKEMVDLIMTKTDMSTVWDAIKAPACDEKTYPTVMGITAAEIPAGARMTPETGWSYYNGFQRRDKITITISITGGVPVSVPDFDLNGKSYTPAEGCALPFSSKDGMIGKYFSALVSYEPEMKKVLFGPSQE